MNKFGYVGDADEKTSITQETRTGENAYDSKTSSSSSAAEQLTPRELQ
jgi:hypothetical protein